MSLTEESVEFSMAVNNSENEHAGAAGTDTSRQARARALDRLIGERIKLRRKTLGISQSKLGAMLGVSYAQIQKYEKGLNRIGVGFLCQIAEALRVPVTFFVSDLADSADRHALPQLTGARELMEAYCAIPSPEQRGVLLAMAQSMAKGS